MAVFKDKYTASWACKFRYKNWQGEVKQHKKTGFKTQKEAREYERSYLDKQQNCCDMTFQSLYEYYIVDCEVRMKPITVANKESNFKTVILPFFGKLKVSDISPANIRQWQTGLIKSEHYSATTLRKFHKTLSAIFNYAVKVYGLKANPCKVAGSMGNNKSKEMQIWSLEEFNKFIAELKGQTDKEALFMLLFYSGMRIGEACALTISDFDFKNNTVSISKNYVVSRGKSFIYTTKTDQSKRTIMLPKTVMNKIREYYFQIYDKDNTTRLFSLTEQCYRRYLDRYSGKAGVKKIRLHDLRHSHASMLIHMNVPIKQISERLGHDNITITLNTYAHIYKEAEEELADKLEAIAMKSVSV